MNYPQPDDPDQTSTDTPSNNGAGTPNPDEEQPDEAAGETALLPASILGGKTFNPGDEVVLKIVALHDDQVEVEYATGKEGKDDDDEDTSEMGAAQSRLGALGSSDAMGGPSGGM